MDGGPRPPVGVTGAVIAGGASRRMGADKRSFPVDGVPMLRRVALAVRAVSDELLVACRRDAPPDPWLLESLDATLVFDRTPDGGPLAGVEAALAEARGELVLVVAADLPWVAPAVLRLLVATAASSPAPAVALRSDRGAEPLLAVYRRAVALPVASRLLAGSERRMRAMLEALPAAEVPPEAWRPLDPSGLTPRNVNAPGDLIAPGDRIAPGDLIAPRDLIAPGGLGSTAAGSGASRRQPARLPSR